MYLSSIWFELFLNFSHFTAFNHHPRFAESEEIDDDYDHYSDDVNFEDDDELDDVALSSPRRTRQQPISTHFIPINGKKKIDMSPPDIKLENSKELAKQFSNEGKVVTLSFLNTFTYFWSFPSFMNSLAVSIMFMSNLYI